MFANQLFSEEMAIEAINTARAKLRTIDGQGDCRGISLDRRMGLDRRSGLDKCRRVLKGGIFEGVEF